MLSTSRMTTRVVRPSCSTSLLTSFTSLTPFTTSLATPLSAPRSSTPLTFNDDSSTTLNTRPSASFVTARLKAPAAGPAHYCSSPESESSTAAVTAVNVVATTTAGTAAMSTVAGHHTGNYYVQQPVHMPPHAPRHLPLFDDRRVDAPATDTPNGAPSTDADTLRTLRKLRSLGILGHDEAKREPRRDASKSRVPADRFGSWGVTSDVLYRMPPSHSTCVAENATLDEASVHTLRQLHAKGVLGSSDRFAEVYKHLGTDGKIGIVGCGQIARAFLQVWLEDGLDKSRVLAACRSEGATSGALRTLGLGDSSIVVGDTAGVVRQSKVVIVGLRAQDILALKDIDFAPDTTIVVLTGGVSHATVKELTGSDRVVLGCASGHDLIMAKKGIVAMYPRDDPVAYPLMAAAGSQMLPPLSSEDAVNLFFSLLPLPAGIVASKYHETPASAKVVEEFVEEAMPVEASEADLDLAGNMFKWAEREAAPLEWSEEKGDFNSYIEDMCTEGGLTEAMVEEVNEGGTFGDALSASLNRCLNLVEKVATAVEGAPVEGAPANRGAWRTARE